jgi:hypothetical protein
VFVFSGRELFFISFFLLSIIFLQQQCSFLVLDDDYHPSERTSSHRPTIISRPISLKHVNKLVAGCLLGWLAFILGTKNMAPMAAAGSNNDELFACGCF